MAKETKEQREMRQAEETRLAAEAQAQFRASVPARLARAKALAERLGVNTSVVLTETGPEVSFHYESGIQQMYISAIVSYTVEEWEMDSLEASLNDLAALIEAAAARRRLAEDTWKLLTVEQRVAIKENIYALY